MCNLIILEQEIKELEIKRDVARREVKEFNTKMKSMKRMLDSFYRDQEAFDKFISKSEEYFSIDLKKNRKSLKADIFCKYGLENGINRYLISEYLGYKYASNIADKRKAVTRLIALKPSAKSDYIRFKEYMNGKD